MKTSIGDIKKELETISRFLDQENLLSFTPDRRRELRLAIQEISARLVSIETDFLTIGLLGGTGVGKSTIMNALAGSRIASTSHRRPHTDKILVYRHEQVHLPSTMSLERVPWLEITHGSDHVRHIILCDLPDFDSIAGEHRRYVIEFLENLDLLVWISSPEKYADRRFHDLLREVPKAGENFAFVLNKADVLFQAESREQGYERMNLAATRFQALIKENGIDDPLLYVISAEEACSSSTASSWNQFPAFRHYVFQQRKAKQIAAIKAVNLDVEVGRLVESFNEEIRQLGHLEAVIDGVLQELRESRKEWMDTGRKALEPWLDRQLLHTIISTQGRAEHLIGPGYGIALLLRLFRRDPAVAVDKGHDLSPFHPPESTAVALRRRMEWIQDRIERDLIYLASRQGAREHLRRNLAVENRFNALGEKFFHATTVHGVDPPLPAFRFFRILQWAAYVFLSGLFVLSIGGQEEWQAVIAAPGFRNLLNLSLSIINVLFSTRGLAALGSYLLLSLFLGFRFYRGYQKRLDRIARRRLDLLKSELLSIWEESLDEILSELQGVKSEAQTRRTTLTGLRTGS